MNQATQLLQKLRGAYKPQLPEALRNIQSLTCKAEDNSKPFDNEVSKLFPKTCHQPILKFDNSKLNGTLPLKVGVVLSGGQAAGGHNVITGLYDALHILNGKSQVFGFLDGPSGIIDSKYIELNNELIDKFRNQGGFDLIGSGRTKIETKEQFSSAEKTVKALELDGLVIIGGDDSNTNAALLAEYFLDKGVKTRVIGVPKTIDGDLKNEFIETSFGFDTATKTYSEIIGNIQRDALSAKKYYFFIKLMGRSASHIALECALQTHPNNTLIGEEIEAEKKTILQITKELADIICERAAKGKDYGVVLIPEGTIEFIPECKQLISELNALLAPEHTHLANLEKITDKTEKVRYISINLSDVARKCFDSLPEEIQIQLLLDRDPHGNVQVSKIETERLFCETVKRELKTRKKAGTYGGKFSVQPLFCGYEGRSCFPSNFDSQYCYALGNVAALLIQNGKTGYMAVVQNLTKPVIEWKIAGIPLANMLHIEQRHGKAKPVIKKALVELTGKPFQSFQSQRKSWEVEDDYQYPGPIQFFGPAELTDTITQTLQLEQSNR